MADDWESLAEKEDVAVPAIIPKNINKWDGEDEEEDVKESWEDEEEKKDEEKIKEETQVKPTETTKVKKSQSKFSEKERQKMEQEELENEKLENMTPEEKLAEKLRLQKIQQEEDLKTALDTFGITESPSGIDGMHPTNKAEFSEFAQALDKKISTYKNADEFPGFVEELLRSVCANLSVADLKKIKLTVENLYLEKQKIEKEKAKKPSGKGKTKVKLRVEEDNVRSNNIDDYGYDYDYDDFM